MKDQNLKHCNFTTFTTFRGPLGDRGFDNCRRQPTLGLKYDLNWNDAISSFVLTWGVWANGRQGDQSSEHNEYLEPEKRFRSTQLDVSIGNIFGPN